jgi:hypothetical protein
MVLPRLICAYVNLRPAEMQSKRPAPSIPSKPLILLRNYSRAKNKPLFFEFGRGSFQSRLEAGFIFKKIRQLLRQKVTILKAIP